ncbi:MAG: hypothetical protein ACHQVK_03665, partial [Candidatus Paceibacterales bacterium]
AKNVQKAIANFQAKGDIQTAANLTSRFESSLRANDKIFASFENIDDKGKNVQSIRGEVHSNLGDLADLRTKLETEIASSSEIQDESGAQVSIKTAADGKISDAENVLASVRNFITNNSGKLGIDAMAQINADLNSSENLVTQANIKFNAGVYGEAFNLANQAISIAQEAETVAQAKAVLDLNIKINTPFKIKGGEDDNKGENDNEIKDGGEQSGSDTLLNSGIAVSSSASTSIQSSFKINNHLKDDNGEGENNSGTDKGVNLKDNLKIQLPSEGEND